MGSVFLAFEPAAQRQVALKVLADNLAKDRIHVDRFYREARIGASLDHPNIVHTYAYGKDPATGRHAMVLEYIDGPSCQYLLDRDGHLQLDDAVLIVYHIAKALAELRDRKIVHRDVKPDNILLTSEGIAKLADFGLAKQLGGPDDLTAHQAAFGSSWYMPFEQAKNAGFVDERSDIFSLGATFYHLLTGQVPFPGESHAEVVALKQSDRYVPVSQVDPRLPPALDPIIARMLALDPRRRYPSARELIIDIEKSRLLNAYRVGTVLPEGGAKSDKERLDIAATSPDLNLDADGQSGHPELPWHLRYQDRAGRTYTRKATTKQVLEGLRAGRWPLGVEAARSERRRFRPLREYPEFQQYLDTPLEGGDLIPPKTAPVPDQKPKRRLRKIWIGVGFVFGLAVAATVASLMRSLLWLAPCDCQDDSLFCHIIQSLRSIW
jgi:serine/threonine-protein kinase